MTMGQHQPGGQGTPSPRRFRVACNLTYEVFEPATFVFSIAAARSRCQKVLSEHLEISPDLPVEEYVFAWADHRMHRIQPPPSILSVAYVADVETAPALYDPAEIAATPPGLLPFETLLYLNPSRYCQSDQFLYPAQRRFGHIAPGYALVDAICDWTHENIDYLSGSTDERVSAQDTALSGFGVCRDFTHLAIAFCRALSIPARFVSGYAYGLQPPDFHTALEVWLDGRWYLFDPTRQSRPENFVRIAVGRDAADVSLASIYGRFSMLDMSVSCEAPDGEPPPATGLAVATA